MIFFVVVSGMCDDPLNVPGLFQIRSNELYVAFLQSEKIGFKKVTPN